MSAFLRGSGAERTRIKFCGIISPREASLAIEAGADAVGVIVAPSPRRVPPAVVRAIAREMPASATLVAVVGCDRSLVPYLIEFGATIQFAAPFRQRECYRLTRGAWYLRVFPLAPNDERDIVPPAEAPSEIPLFDCHANGRLGGSGVPFAWSRVAKLASLRPIVIAGGLSPANVANCIATVRPFAVDVRSGIEIGERKSPRLMRAFVRAVRDADAAAVA